MSKFSGLDYLVSVNLVVSVSLINFRKSSSGLTRKYILHYSEGLGNVLRPPHVIVISCSEDKK